jgi:hypothetical protein
MQIVNRRLLLGDCTELWTRELCIPRLFGTVFLDSTSVLEIWILKFPQFCLAGWWQVTTWLPSSFRWCLHNLALFHIFTSSLIFWNSTCIIDMCERYVFVNVGLVVLLPKYLFLSLRISYESWSVPKPCSKLVWPIRKNIIYYSWYIQEQG